MPIKRIHTDSRAFTVWPAHTAPKHVVCDVEVPGEPRWVYSDIPAGTARELASLLLSAADEIDPPTKAHPADDWASSEEPIRALADAVNNLADAKRYSEEGIRARRDAYDDWERRGKPVRYKR